MMKRFCLTLLGMCVFAAAALAPTAVADPTHGKNALQLQIVCGGKTYQVVVNGNGRFTPAHIVGSTSVLVPHSLDLTTTFTPTGGSTMTQHQTLTKAGPVKHLLSCTIPFQSFASPGGTFTIAGTATAVITPRHH
jgi:hypothetical protein